MQKQKQIASKAIPDVQNRYYGTTEDTRTGKILIKDLPESSGDELYYKRMIQYAQNSATAKRCVEVLQSFIVADGFTDRNFAEQNPNMFQTWDDLLSEIGYSWAYCDGFAFNIFVNAATGKFERIETMPFYKIVRTNRNTFILYCCGFGKTKN